MEVDELVDVDVGHAVTVGDHEAVGIDVAGHALQAAALEGLLAGVAQGHAPVLDLAGMGGDGAAAQVHGEVRVADVVVVEILFDVFALVAQGQDEVLEAEAGIDVHDVPEHGPPADLDHGLGFDDGLFPQPGALAAAHDDDFHTASACPPRERDSSCQRFRIATGRDGAVGRGRC